MCNSCEYSCLQNDLFCVVCHKTLTHSQSQVNNCELIMVIMIICIPTVMSGTEITSAVILWDGIHFCEFRYMTVIVF